ncbi:MAG: hypothetical protein WD334_03600, partial [Chitinophagales bacterium]
MKSLSIQFILVFFAIAAFFSACKKDEGPDLTECEEVQERLDPVLAEGEADFADYFTSAGNKVEDPGFTPTSITPSLSGGNFSSGTGSIVSTNYYGAIDPNGSKWYEGWSFFEQILAGGTTDKNRSAMVDGKPEMTISSNITSNDTFTNDNVYILDGRIYVTNNATLTIEAGTVVKAKKGQGSSATALIVSRNGKIMAEGTATEPIIFTSVDDNLKGSATADTRGLWGGVLLLGKARLNSGAGETAIEGIPTNETDAIYGGNDDGHSSGTMRYVSIRHTGTDIGAGNEIQGLTMGGVGSGTTIEYIESVGSNDDGYEWFGGTVNAKYLISLYNGDDALDYDEGFRGETQFVINYQDPSAENADRGGEHDGGTDPETGEPYSTPKFYNVTSVGNSGSRTITFRDNAGGEYHNSIFVNYGRGIDIELKDSDQDSYKQFVDGSLKLENNVFHNIGAGDQPADLFT